MSMVGCDTVTCVTVTQACDMAGCDTVACVTLSQPVTVTQACDSGRL